MNTNFVITVVILALILSCQQRNVNRQAEEITNKVLEIWNSGNINLIDEICAPEYVRRYVQIYEDIVGIDAYKEWLYFNQASVLIQMGFTINPPVAE
jgi:hypothetical protein